MCAPSKMYKSKPPRAPQNGVKALKNIPGTSKYILVRNVNCKLGEQRNENVHGAAEFESNGVSLSMSPPHRTMQQYGPARSLMSVMNLC